MIKLEENPNCLLFNIHVKKMIVPKSYNLSRYEIFYSKNPPIMTIKQFIDYLMSFNLVEHENLHISQIYCIALLQKLFRKGFSINMNNCHRIILIMLMLTSKLIEDECHYNGSWARVSGLDLEELNKMEYTMLQLLDFDIFVSQEQLIHINKSFFIK
jgi:hypothetical protein